ncbi:MAG: hypothetical protein QOE45_2782 [Frankiaceae bacterium]|jgi:hypothetical protein|nr:hypothetical protein [Frankiaceae bacterium]
MRKLSAAGIKKLKLATAIAEEAAAVRNLVPREPGWDRLADRADELSHYIGNRLKAGYTAAPAREVSARKPGHGIRPVPYLGVIERTVYRALVAALLKSQPPLDRSPEAYLTFVGAPIRYAAEFKPNTGTQPYQGLFNFLESPIEYIVKSDITSFYQFVDHAILAEELLVIGGDFELIELLLDLLEETQGRTYGLPQLFDASDALSELYIDRVERDLVRGGLAVWRFNDDFRIACVDYSAALAAIERLDTAARACGLVVSEHKTFTVGFVKYLIATLGQQVMEDGPTISPDEVEDILGDYSDEFGEDDADEAMSVIERAKAEDVGETDIDLRNVRQDDIRLIRRAINGLAQADDVRGLEDMFRLVVFVPSLTPTVMRYITTVAPVAEEGTLEPLLHGLSQHASLNDWQRLWLVDTAGALGLLEGELPLAAEMRGWVQAVRSSTRVDVLRAAATWALAAAGLLDVSEILADADDASSALLTIYARALLDARGRLSGDALAQADVMLDAFGKSSIVHATLCSRT